MNDDVKRDVRAAVVEEVPATKRRWEAPVIDVVPLSSAQGNFVGVGPDIIYSS